MDEETGGQSSGERQRQTAAEIARRKVLESYGANPNNFEHSKDVQGPQVDSEEWKKYHSAWQDYYQKYYGAYYSQAAKDYIEQSKLKFERSKAEQAAKVEEVIDKGEEEIAEDMQKNIREKIRQKASGQVKKVRRSKHFIPVVVGALIILVGLFFQYNQVIFANVAAYVTPGGGAVNDITAIDPSITTEVGPESVLIIPKLNVEVPVVFGAANDTISMNNAMNNGVAHFAIPGASAVPGEIGNYVVSGHSAGNVYRASDYKFIFSGLDRLVEGDLIYMNYDSVRYTYSVTRKETVDPSNVAALTAATEKPILTLITCTPLGTSKYRLLVFADQVSPDYSGAATSEPSDPTAGAETEMPANDPSPLEQFWNWLTGQ